MKYKKHKSDWLDSDRHFMCCSLLELNGMFFLNPSCLPWKAQGVTSLSWCILVASSYFESFSY